MFESREWNPRLERMTENWRRSYVLGTRRWENKLLSLLSVWNVWRYQINGQQPTVFTPPKRYYSWAARLPLINQQWNYPVKMVGWNRRLDCLRRAWTDAGKQIKGGIVFMVENEIKNERLRMQDLRDMLDKQGYKCALTGRQLTHDNCSIDHVLPLCKGGSHTKENAQLVVAEANHAKGNLTDAEFLRLCRDVVAYADRGLACPAGV